MHYIVHRYLVREVLQHNSKHRIKVSYLGTRTTAK
jgi:hypothetical protein